MCLFVLRAEAGRGSTAGTLAFFSRHLDQVSSLTGWGGTVLGWWIRKRSRGETWEGQKAGRLELGQEMRPGEVPGKGLGGVLLRVHLCHQSGFPQKPLLWPCLAPAGS